MCNHNAKRDRCTCHGARVEGFIQPCILLLLYERPAHGYELIDRLAEFGFENTPPDPGTVYRNLRRMEEEGFVKSKWETQGTGPARRLYEVTREGEEYLHAWATTIKRNRKRLDYFLERYGKNFKQN